MEASCEDGSRRNKRDSIKLHDGDVIRVNHDHNQARQNFSCAHDIEYTFKSYKLFKLDTGAKRLPMESRGFGRGETRHVVSLAFPYRQGRTKTES